MKTGELCVCGHAKSNHDFGKGRCFRIINEQIHLCGCKKFRVGSGEVRQSSSRANKPAIPTSRVEGATPSPLFPDRIKVHFVVGCGGKLVCPIECMAGCRLCSGEVTFNHPFTRAVEYEKVKSK